MQMKLGFKLQVDKNRVVLWSGALQWTGLLNHFNQMDDMWAIWLRWGNICMISMEWLLQYYCSLSVAFHVFVIYIVLIQSLNWVFTIWIIRMKPAKLTVLTCAWYIYWWNGFHCKAVFNEDGVRKNRQDQKLKTFELFTMDAQYIPAIFTYRSASADTHLKQSCYCWTKL